MTSPPSPLSINGEGELTPATAGVSERSEGDEARHGGRSIVVCELFDEFDDDAVERGHGLIEVEVVVVIAVDAVGDGFKSEEWRIVAQTDLGDGTAFHFDEEGVEVVAHGIGSRATLGKPIARGAEPAQIWDGDFVECAFGAIEVRDGEMDAIDRADISQGIAASGRVDVVLNEFIGEHNRADGGVYEAACDADIDDEIGGISIDAELCCHGGVDFANATGTGDEVFAETIEIHASGGFCAFDSFIAKK